MKYRVTRTYTMKTHQEWVLVEAETPEAASEAAKEELDANEIEKDISGIQDLVDVQEEAEEVGE